MILLPWRSPFPTMFSIWEIVLRGQEFTNTLFCLFASLFAHVWHSATVSCICVCICVYIYPPHPDNKPDLTDEVVDTLNLFMVPRGFPHSSVGKESACNAGDLGSIPESGRSPGEGDGNPLQYSCLENPMDRGAWWATVHRASRVRHDLATIPPPAWSLEQG